MTCWRTGSLRPTSDRAADATRGIVRTSQTAAGTVGHRPTVDARRGAECARPDIHRRVSEPQMGRGLHPPLDRRRLVLRRRGRHLFSRRVVDWSMRATMTAQLVTDALVNGDLAAGQARGRVASCRSRQPLPASPGRPRRHHSMSRAGNVWDNAGESFFSH
jgi:hypothetical protein